MKNYKFSIKNILCMTVLTGGLLLGSTSCNDMLDTKPNGSFSSEQIGEDEAVQLLTAAYAGLLNHFIGNNEAFSGPINNWVWDVRSDDAVKGGEAPGMELNIHELEIGNVQSDNASFNFKWLNDYYAISRCNDAIRALKSSSQLSDKERASMIGEMKTLRAFFFFDLYRIFKAFPYFDENDNPSTVPSDRYTREEIIGFIIKDLQDSYLAMEPVMADKGRFNKYVAAALLARVALFDHRYEMTEEYAGYVISCPDYDLYNNFLDMSKVEFNNGVESVLACQFRYTSDAQQLNYSNCINCTYSENDLYGTGDDFYLGSQDLINAFRTDANGLPFLDGTHNSESITSADYSGNVDPRLDFTFGRIGMPWRSYMYNEKWCRALNLYGQYSSKKYYPSPDIPDLWTVGGGTWGGSSLNMMLIRYADVKLMYAEALIEQGKNLEEARIQINDIRRRAARSVNPTYAPVDCDPLTANYLVSEYPTGGWTQDYARKALRMERRLELAMEGHRWFDLVRWGEAVNVINKYYTFEKQYQIYYEGASLSEDELYAPIPLDQVNNSNGLYKN